MASDQQPLHGPPPHGQEPPPRSRADDARRKVVDAVSDAKFAADPAGQEIDVYLALLQDRLPVYVGTMTKVLGQAGRASVQETLVLAAAATIDFYCGVLAAKVSVLAKPAQLARLRQVMKVRRMGPHQADEAVAGYLRREQELGRIPDDADPPAAARLLIGGCLNYAFTLMLVGEDEMPRRDEYAAGIVRGLHLHS